jgi:hypothetical protein
VSKDTFTQDGVRIEIEGVTVIGSVTYRYQKGDPGCMYPRNGDPGWPPEPPEIEVLAAKVDGQDVPPWFLQALQESESIFMHLDNNHAEPEREYERDAR